jgi:hypothetical protein
VRLELGGWLPVCVAVGSWLGEGVGDEDCDWLCVRLGEAVCVCDADFVGDEDAVPLKEGHWVGLILRVELGLTVRLEERDCDCVDVSDVLGLVVRLALPDGVDVVDSLFVTVKLGLCVRLVDGDGLGVSVTVMLSVGAWLALPDSVRDADSLPLCVWLGDCDVDGVSDCVRESVWDAVDACDVDAVPLAEGVKVRLGLCVSVVDNDALVDMDTLWVCVWLGVAVSLGLSAWLGLLDSVQLCDGDAVELLDIACDGLAVCVSEDDRTCEEETVCDGDKVGVPAWDCVAPWEGDCVGDGIWLGVELGVTALEGVRLGVRDSVGDCEGVCVTELVLLEVWLGVGEHPIFDPTMRNPP